MSLIFFSAVLIVGIHSVSDFVFLVFVQRACREGEGSAAWAGECSERREERAGREKKTWGKEMEGEPLKYFPISSTTKCGCLCVDCCILINGGQYSVPFPEIELRDSNNMKLAVLQQCSHFWNWTLIWTLTTDWMTSWSIKEEQQRLAAENAARETEAAKQKMAACSFALNNVQVGG